VGQRVKKHVHPLHTGLWAAGEVDNQGSATDDGDAPGQHGVSGEAQRRGADGLRDPGGQALGHGQRGLRGAVPGRKARAAGGEDQVRLPLVAKVAELDFQLLRLVGQQKLLDHGVARVLQTRSDGGAAAVLSLPPAALVAEGDDRRLPGERLLARLDGDDVSNPDRPALQHPCEHALPWHDAVASLPADGAAGMTGLSDLAQFQQRPAAAKQRAHRQGAQVKAGDHKIFAKGPPGHLDAFGPKRLDLLRAEEAHLPMPAARVGVALQTPVGPERRLLHPGFQRALLRAGAHSQYRTHIRQPPISFMRRSSRSPMSSKKAWRDGLRRSASATAAVMVPSDAPPRSSSRRSRPSV